MQNATLKSLIKNNTTVYYPSAGNDLRDLMIMSGITPKYVPYSYRCELLSRFAKLFGKNNRGESILPQPSLFVHSDIWSWEKEIKFKVGEVFFRDSHTSIVVKDLTELPRLKFSGDVNRFGDLDNEEEIGRCALMTIEITSDLLGTFERQLVYVCSANEIFAAEYLLANNLHVAGPVHVRYGIGFGGAKGSGSWLKAIMPKVNAGFMFTDIEIDYEDRARSWEVYPELGGMEGAVRYVDAIPARFWSGISDVQLVVSADSRNYGPRNVQEYVR